MVVAFFVSAAFTQMCNAQTEILTFDDLPSIYGTAQIPNGYGGLQWQNFWYLNAVTYWGNPSGYSNGLVSADNVAFNANGDPAQIGGGLFDLNSAYLTGAWNDGLQLEVQGFIGSTLIYDNTYTVNTAGPTLINLNYLGIDEANFISFGGTHNSSFAVGGEQFAVDNLNVTLVPEPTSMWLLAAGILGMILLRHRQIAC